MGSPESNPESSPASSPGANQLFAAKGNARPATASHQPAKALLGSIEAKLDADRDALSSLGPTQPALFSEDPPDQDQKGAADSGEPGSVLTIDLKRPRIPNLTLAESEGAAKPEVESDPHAQDEPTPALNGTLGATPEAPVRDPNPARESEGMSPLSQALIAGVAVACLAGGLWYAVQTSGQPAPAQPEPPTLPTQQTAEAVPEPVAVPEPAPPPETSLEPLPAVQSETAPSFDLVRIEPDGQAVLAGRAEPRASLIILDNGQPIGIVSADSVGEWAFVPDRPLPKGDHDFSLVVNAPQGVLTVPSPAPDKPGAKPELSPGAATPPEPAAQAPVPDRKPAPAGEAQGHTGGYAIQLASVSSQQDAEAAWLRLSATYPALLDDMAPAIEPAEIDNQGLLYRVRAGDFVKSDQAETLCRALRAQDQDCIVVQR